MKVIKVIKITSIVDKREMPVVGENYEVVAEHLDRPVIMVGTETVWLNKDEFEEVTDE